MKAFVGILWYLAHYEINWPLFIISNRDNID